jgi:hypothetical protein
MIIVVVQTREPRRQDEALRAALGLTLRGAQVAVVLAADVALTSPLACRAAATLRSFGHTVEVATAADLRELATADAVEVWT